MGRNASTLNPEHNSRSGLTFSVTPRFYLFAAWGEPLVHNAAPTMDVKRWMFFCFVVCFFLLLENCESWRRRRRRRRCWARNCAVSSWTSYSWCSRSCGTGTQARTRYVTRGASCGGSCPHSLRETQYCNRFCCPVSCTSSWGSWGSCQGCGRNGRQTRTLRIISNPSCGGTRCPSSRSQTRSCISSRCCPVNCAVSSWSGWGRCSARCESAGRQARTRRITTPASCNGRPCPTLTQYKSCRGPCCKRDCVLSKWSAWGKCIAPKGSCATNSGRRTRSRRVAIRQSCGGTCFALRHTTLCTPVPRKCQMSSWNGWSICKLKGGTCGSGTQSRTRTTTVQPYCAPKCPTATENRNCIHSCCPSHCVLSQWSAWGTCTASCGPGKQSRKRRIQIPASCGGKCSSDLSQSKSCTVVRKIDCQLSSWSGWTICSSGCGNGIQRRSRRITVNPTSCGRQCGALSDTKQCTSYRENRDCQVGNWVPWSECDSKCSYGTKIRSRTITVTKRCRGKNCPALKGSTRCGLPNGGCQHICERHGGKCSCYVEYDSVNRTHCSLKDCGKPMVDYCPKGEEKGTVCKIPKIDCPHGKTTFQTQCTVTCPLFYELKGLEEIEEMAERIPPVRNSRSLDTSLDIAEGYIECEGIWPDRLRTTYCRRINDPPSDINLSGDHSVPENSDSKTVVGTLSSVDVNAKDKHTYVLLSSYRGVLIRNVSDLPFEISGNILRTTRKLDYEETSVWVLFILSRDDGSPPQTYAKNVSINVRDVNEKPIDITLSNVDVDENAGLGTVIASFSTKDPDRGQTYSYSLVDDAAGLFRVQGNQLQVAIDNERCLSLGGQNCRIDFEKARSFDIRVRSQDSGSPQLSTERNFTIEVKDINDKPRDLELSANKLPENATKGFLIGQLTATDEDVGQVLKFKLTNDDNGRFQINKDGYIVKAKNTNYENQKVHRITVEVSDNGEPVMKTSKDFIIIVKDVNEAPVNLQIVSTQGQISFSRDSPKVKENTATGENVGMVYAYDDDIVEKLVFTLDDDGDGAFAISNKTQCSSLKKNGKHLYTGCRTLLAVASKINYEEASTRSIIVRVTDTKGLHHSQQFTVEIIDENDKPNDITLNGLHIVTVNENRNDTLIASFKTQDEDLSQNHSYRIINNPEMRLVIKDGKLYTSPTGEFDYEKENKYIFTVETTDNGKPPMSFRRNFTLQVMDMNEAPTSIELSNDAVDENSAVGTLVGNITVSDPDNEGKYATTQKVSCHMITDTAGVFEIKNDAQLVVKKASLNFEEKASHSIIVKCTDDGVPYKSLEKVLTININNVNEAPTGMHLSSNRVRENYPLVTVGRLVVSDPDQKGQTFTMHLTDKSLPFKVAGDVLITTQSLNYERKSVYKISVRATDQGGLSVTENYTILVQDINDSPSTIIFHHFPIEESAKPGTPVADAVAIDEDFDQIHTYSIESIVGFGYGLTRALPGKFTIDAKAGLIITTSSGIDYEEFKAFNITVMAIDNGIPAMNISKIVTINVQDVNHPPTDILFNGTEVKENCPEGHIVGNVTVIDPDNKYHQKDIYICKLDVPAEDSLPFAISSEYTLIVNGTIDYEKLDIYEIKVTCTDDRIDPYNISRTFVVKVLNVNEAPSLIHITSNKIAENQDVGSFIANVIAVDPDNEVTHVDNITIQLLPELDGAAFRLVDGNSLIANQTFNYEQKNIFNVKIRASDNGRPVLSSEKIFNITITDVNERPTDITLSSSTVAENSAKGTKIGEFSTEDEDQHQEYKYSLISNHFELRGNQLCVLGNPDFETNPKIDIVIQVTDSGNPALSFKKHFLITVTDVNDPPSDLIATVYPIPENNTMHKIVATLRLVDEDSQQSMKNCNPDYFSFDRISTKEISMYVNGSDLLDFEKKPFLHVTVECFDDGTPALSIKKNISIPVLDSNEEPTGLFINGGNLTKLPENPPVGSVVGRLSCIDQDAGQSHRYELLTFGDIFMINENVSLLIVRNNSKLDYEMFPSSSSPIQLPVSIKVTDNGHPSMSFTSTIQIEVTDVNEAPSNIRLIHTLGNKIPENVAIDTNFGEVIADNPEGSRQQLTYSILNWNETFAITWPSSIMECEFPCPIPYLTVKGELNFDRKASYNLTVKVTDNGIPTLSAQNIITVNVERTDPCYSGTLDCGREICQRINKTDGNCGCLAGYEPKKGACVQIDDCKSNCLYCEDSKKACQAKKECPACYNNATCEDELNNFKCNCLAGFTDKRCEADINDCAASPCKHGSCFDFINRYQCECDEGYEGRNCDTNINDCNIDTCIDGKCTDLVAGFSCQCTDGISGLLCNRRDADCTPGICGKNRCVPPSYKDYASLSKGGQRAVCASDDQVAVLTFARTVIPQDLKQENKWKFEFSEFIKKMTNIPFFAVDLEEEASNGGFYRPTDVVIYPSTSKTKSWHVPLTVKVQNKLVPRDALLRAINKTCTGIRKTSRYWAYCNSTHFLITELGIPPKGEYKTKNDDYTMYMLIGGAVGLILIIAVILMIISRRRRQRSIVMNNGRHSASQLISESDGSYYDAMVRHMAKRQEESEAESEYPMSSADEFEPRHNNRMFTNPVAMSVCTIESEQVDDAILMEPGNVIVNPVYDQVNKPNETATD